MVAISLASRLDASDNKTFDCGLVHTHGCVLHSWVRRIGPQLDDGPVSTARVCIWMPPPQLAEHGPNCVQEVKVQLELQEVGDPVQGVTWVYCEAPRTVHT